MKCFSTSVVYRTAKDMSAFSSERRRWSYASKCHIIRSRELRILRMLTESFNFAFYNMPIAVHGHTTSELIKKKRLEIGKVAVLARWESI